MVLYKTNSSDSSDRKVFLTTDSPSQVLTYYKNTLIGKGWAVDDNYTQDPSNSLGMSKGGDVIVILADTDSQNYVTGSSGKTYILLVQGTKTS